MMQHNELEVGTISRDVALQKEVKLYFKRLEKYDTLGRMAANLNLKNTDDEQEKAKFRNLLDILHRESRLHMTLRKLQKQNYYYTMDDVLNALYKEAQQFVRNKAQFSKSEEPEKRKNLMDLFFPDRKQPIKNKSIHITTLQQKCLSNLVNAFDELPIYDSSLRDAVVNPFTHTIPTDDEILQVIPFDDRTQEITYFDDKTTQAIPFNNGTHPEMPVRNIIVTNTSLVPIKQASVQKVGEEVKKIAETQLNRMFTNIESEADVRLGTDAAAYHAISSSIRLFLDYAEASGKKFAFEEFREYVITALMQENDEITINLGNDISGFKQIPLRKTTINRLLNVQEDDLRRAISMHNMRLLPSRPENIYDNARQHMVQELKIPTKEVGRFLKNLEKYSGEFLRKTDLEEMCKSVQGLINYVSNTEKSYGTILTDIGVAVKKASKKSASWLINIMQGQLHNEIYSKIHVLSKQKVRNSEDELAKKSKIERLQKFDSDYQCFIKGLM